MTYVLPYFVRCLSHFVPQYKLKATAIHQHTHNILVKDHLNRLDLTVNRIIYH